MKFGQEGILLSQAGHTYIRRSDSSGKMPCKKTNNFRGRSSPKHLVVAAAAAATDSDQSEVCLLSYFYEIPANPSLKPIERTFDTKQNAHTFVCSSMDAYIYLCFIPQLTTDVIDRLKRTVYIIFARYMRHTGTKFVFLPQAVGSDGLPEGVVQLRHLLSRL